MAVLRVEYDPRVVILTCAVGFIGAFAAVSSCEQFRLSAARSEHRTMRWMWFVAFSFGGICIWGTHFVGMASFKLMLGEREIPMYYDMGNMIYLLVVELFFGFTTVYFASTDDCFNRSRKEIMEKFIAHASATYNINEIKHMSQMRLLYIVLTHSTHRPLIAGLIAGVSMAAMHYVGIMGLRFQGTVRYDGGIVAASCLSCIVVIVAAFWIFFRVLSMFPSIDLLRIVVACNGMVSISGVHYIGLQATTFHYNPDAPAPNMDAVVTKRTMLIGVTVFSALVVFVILISVLSDLRAWLLRTSTQLRQAELVIESNQKLCAGRAGRYAQITRDTTRYMRKYVYKHTAEENGHQPGDARHRLLYYDLSDDEDNSSAQSIVSRRSSVNTTHLEGTETSAVRRIHDMECMSDGGGTTEEGGVTTSDALDHYHNRDNRPKPSPRQSTNCAEVAVAVSVKLSSVLPYEEGNLTRTHTYTRTSEVEGAMV